MSSPALVAAALRLIGQICVNIHIDVDWIAGHLHSLRSTLYRPFAAEGLKVAECIRALRGRTVHASCSNRPRWCGDLDRRRAVLLL